MRYDVCIIGGGAAGLAAAASLDDALSVCIIEKNRIPGRKILATGGGRCNMTNDACEDKQLTMDFFESLGLKMFMDGEGRYYPYSQRASDVVGILERGISDKADFYFETAAEAVIPSGNHFTVECFGGATLEAGRVILAAGGKAGPCYGTTGDGYSMAAALGHKVGKLYPILCGVECSEKNRRGEKFDFASVKGIRAKAAVKLLRDGMPVTDACETGELQFTGYGLSGICVFNLTPYIRTEAGENFRDAMSRYEIAVDLAPDFSESEVSSRESSFGILTAELAELTEGMNIKNLLFAVSGVRGWKEAQCTGGGVSTDDVSMSTMESKLVPGFYLAGEILDIQGPCGGYNLQNAWETGIRAAKAINEDLILL